MPINQRHYKYITIVLSTLCASYLHASADMEMNCLPDDNNCSLSTPVPLEKIQVDPNANKITESGYSVLVDASEAGNIQRIKYLIEHGANINYQHEDGTFPLYMFVVNGYLKNDKKESLNLVKWMIEKGADYKKKGYNKYSLIHASTDLELTKYLIEMGMDINSLTENGATTLMGSMAYELEGQPEETSLQEYLIEHCVDLNQKAKFDSEVITTSEFAKQYERFKAYNLIENAIRNTPKQCHNSGILAPKLSFYNLPETFDSENATIHLQVEAQGSGIGEIVFKINGSEIASTQDSTVSTPSAGLKIKSFNVKLQNGLNEIRAYAYDDKNKIKSDEIAHNIVADYKITTKPKIYAVVVGIDEFEDKSLSLQYAAADASLLGTTLYKRSQDIYSDVNIAYMRKTFETTKEAILNKLNSLKNISANDLFVFYSATHGVSIDDKYYMITSNIKSATEKEIKENAISEDELRLAFKRIPTANKLLLFDTCYSGSINEKVSKELAKSAVKTLNLTSITAASSVQTAMEGFADGHGVFTFVLTDALDGKADINNDGVVQSMELVNYANNMVPVEAKKFKHIQTPAFFQSGQVFSVAKNKDYNGKIEPKSQYFKPQEIEKLVTYMDQKNIGAMNQLIKTNAVETKQIVEKIKNEAAVTEAKNAVETFKNADKKFQFGQHEFIFNDNSIFLSIKDPIKEHFHFVDGKGRNLIVFDFNSSEPAPRVVTGLNTEKVSDIYMADRGDWYRVVLQTKSKQSYDYIVKAEGIFIKLKNAE